MKLTLTNHEMSVCVLAVQQAIAGNMQNFPTSANQMISLKAMESILREVGEKFEISTFKPTKTEYKRSIKYYQGYALLKALEYLPTANDQIDLDRNIVLDKINRLL